MKAVLHSTSEKIRSKIASIERSAIFKGSMNYPYSTDKSKFMLTKDDPFSVQYR